VIITETQTVIPRYQTFCGGAGCFVHMPPKLQHGIAAHTPVVLLLTIHKKALD
jgi:hypothetical protein